MTSSLLLSLDCSAQGLCSGAACPTLTPSPVSETAEAARQHLSFHSADCLKTLDPLASPQKLTQHTGIAQVSATTRLMFFSVKCPS